MYEYTTLYLSEYTGFDMCEHTGFDMSKYTYFLIAYLCSRGGSPGGHVLLDGLLPWQWEPTCVVAA